MKKIHPFISTIFIKFVKDRIYRYKPSLSMSINEELEIIPCNSRACFNGTNPEIFAVMIAVCQK